MKRTVPIGGFFEGIIKGPGEDGLGDEGREGGGEKGKERGGGGNEKGGNENGF